MEKKEKEKDNQYKLKRDMAMAIGLISSTQHRQLFSTQTIYSFLSVRCVAWFTVA